MHLNAEVLNSKMDGGEHAMAAKKKTTPKAPAAADEPAPRPAAAAGPEPEGTRPPVAGIVASAGGLDAFKKLFAAMPQDTGIAFVLVPHLDPGHQSLMADLLARHTTMPVVEASNDMPVLADHVYVIPPNKYMTIRGGILRLTGPIERLTSQTSIDLFLRSLADDQRERSICIILSGTGSHGSLGLKAVKAAGGMAMVQDPATAAYERMPQSAVATGLADYVLPVEEMPEVLVGYVGHAYLNGGARVEPPAEEADQFVQILALLRARSGFDFRAYRKRMLMRRIERRMGLVHLDSIPEYVKLLQEHPEELHLLVKDLFISVTSFFRDPEAFQQLASQVLAPFVQSKEDHAVIRVWVPGCATGEEPYSIGMLLLEALEAAHKSCRVQIFATDVDQDTLAVARKGIYPDTISADVSPGRLKWFFTKVDEQSYQVSKSLRETATFAVQNLINDAPFTKLDLISCRNLLIYLEPDVQKKVVALFHFALNTDGFLFLGPSETIGRHPDLFESVSRKWRIYRRIGPQRPHLVEFPIGAGSQTAESGRLPGAAAKYQPINFAEVAQRVLLDQFAPAAVLINRRNEILYYFGPCARYLEFPTGEPTYNLIRMAREGLRTRLRAALEQALGENQIVTLTDVQVKRNSRFHPACVTIRPIHLPKAAEGLLLVTFADETPSAPPASAPPSALPVEDGYESKFQQLEFELKATREDLQSTIEELESSNEELKASNEESVSMNEELQSANEELESSKEELQSLNEELVTVNHELHETVDELETANNDLTNLLKSTDIATIFLDTEFRIKLFTPAAIKLFNLMTSDLGRPLSDIRPRFSDASLLTDAVQVVQQLTPREQEVAGTDGGWWHRRIMPYLTRDNRIEGVVITFVDITERKRTADAIMRRLAAIVETSADAIYSKALDGTIQTWNQGAERLYGYSRDEAVGRSVKMLLPGDRVHEFPTIMTRVGGGQTVQQLETERMRKDGQRVPVALTVSPLHDGNGKIVSASVIARDISERRRADQALRDREARIQAILDAAADAIIATDQRGIIQSVNPAAERMFGYSAAEMLGQNVTLLMASPYQENHDGYLERYLETGEKHIVGISREVEARRKDGSIFPTELSVSEIKELKLFIGIHRDLTQRKRLEREVVESVSLEQRRIGQDLHDSVAQELTALNLLAKDVAESLETDPAKAASMVKRIGEGAQRSQRELRAVLRGLLPVAVDREGLMAALAELAQRTQEEGKVLCTFDCPKPVVLADNLAATHLYLIAHEAVYNALKHAQARNIHISLEANDVLVLGVQDDGIGMPKRPRPSQGLGLRIMRNRAAILGAALTIEPIQPNGTRVACKLARRDHEQE
jgi:two-component system CheB/CheR fusion protein